MEATGFTVMTQMQTCLSREEFDLVSRAMIASEFYYSSVPPRQERWSDGTRKSYFTHPLAVVDYLLKWGCDADTIAAGFLHDVLEDVKGVTEADLAKQFGSEVAFLVQAVTKDKSSAMSPSQKLEEALAKDQRALFIKLADRQHNLLTLVHMKNLDKERGKVEETLADYVPLARRWGQEDLAAALEGLAYRELARIERAGEWYGKG